MPLSADTPAPVSAISLPGPASASRHLARMSFMRGCYNRTMVRWVILTAAMFAIGSACARASDESEVKQWQTPPPPRDTSPPPTLRIELKIDGAVRDPITAAKLQATKPDFSDEDRSAWLIQTL